jgi:hypothetical protein
MTRPDGTGSTPVHATDALAVAHETNRRLNRRIQKTESRARKWRRRFAAVQKNAERWGDIFFEEYRFSRDAKKELARWERKRFCAACISYARDSFERAAIHHAVIFINSRIDPKCPHHGDTINY